MPPFLIFDLLNYKKESCLVVAWSDFWDYALFLYFPFEYTFFEACLRTAWTCRGSLMGRSAFTACRALLPSYARDVADEECKAGLAYVEDTFKEAISVWQEWTAAAAADKASVRPFNIKQFNVACTRLDRNHCSSSGRCRLKRAQTLQFDMVGDYT